MTLDSENRAESFLQIIRRAERGRLKIYLGYSPGVGKTYQMLQEAHRLKPDGADVVVGVVETHGRPETAKLLEGLEIIPRRKVEYHGVIMEEMDLDAIIAPESRQFLGQILGIERSGSLLPGLPVRLQTSFGWEVTAEVTSVPRPGTGGWLLVFRDTTLKVQLQEQLDRMDALYRGLVEDSPDIIYVLDERAHVLFINDTVETLLGYSKSEIIGRDLIELVHPDDRQQAYWPLRERRHADRATRALRLRFLTRAGRPRRYDLDIV